MSSGVVKMLTPLASLFAKRYQAAVATKLTKYGLRYDDLLCPKRDLDVEEALMRVPQQDVDLRSQRLKRAQDLSMKHVYLTKDLQAKQTPFGFYLSPMVEQVKLENEEKMQLGSPIAIGYNRQLP